MLVIIILTQSIERSKIEIKFQKHNLIEWCKYSTCMTYLFRLFNWFSSNISLGVGFLSLVYFKSLNNDAKELLLNMLGFVLILELD